MYNVYVIPSFSNKGCFLSETIIVFIRSPKYWAKSLSTSTYFKKFEDSDLAQYFEDLPPIKYTVRSKMKCTQP